MFIFSEKFGSFCFFTNLSVLALIWQVAVYSEFSKWVGYLGSCHGFKILLPWKVLGSSKEGNHFQGMWLNFWKSVHVSIFEMEIKEPNVVFFRPPLHCTSVISNYMLPGTSSIDTVKGVKSKFIDFSFDLKSVNLLLSSVLRSATAEEYFTVSMTMRSGKPGRCVRPPFWNRISHTWCLLSNDLMWSNRCDLIYLCIAFFGGRWLKTPDVRCLFHFYP